MTKILALLDGSSYGESVADNAAWAAGRLGADVKLLHVIGRRSGAGAPADYSGNLDAGAREQLLGELAEFDEKANSLARKRARLMLGEAAARIRETGVQTVEERLRSGDLLAEIGEMEASTDLLVVGKRGEAADMAKLHLGSNLERVLRVAQRPVLAAARAFRPMRRFLLAFDGSRAARAAVAHVAANPLLSGMEGEILMVADRTEDKGLDEAADTLTAAGFGVTKRIEAGEPDDVIAADVDRDDIDLVVMGAYGHSRIRNYLIGSTTSEIVRTCMRPVLMVR